MPATARQMTSSVRSMLAEKLENRTAKVGVVGLGYVGLSIALAFARNRFKVVGIDQDATKVKEIIAGTRRIDDISSDELCDQLLKKNVCVGSDFGAVGELDVIVIAVPTPLNRNHGPDLTFIENATRQVSTCLRPGQLICLESTTFPGTTDQVVLPILQSKGLKVEEDFFLVYSPERVDPGNKDFNTTNTVKMVGGAGKNSLELGTLFYSKAIEKVLPVSSTQVAEMAKIFENTFRSVNIALVNEMALLCDRMGMNVWEVLDAAFTKPFGIMPFYPGPGVGGHCIPLDPHYLEWKAKEFNFATHFISLASEVNRHMPSFVVEKAGRILNERGVALSKSKLLLCGLAYKKDVSDYRESPSLEVLNLFLEKTGASVKYHDPFIPSVEFGKTQMHSTNLSEFVLREADLVIVLTQHSQINYNWLVAHARQVFDTRNATKDVKDNRTKICLL